MYRIVEGSFVRVWFEMQASSLRFYLLVGALTQGQSSAIDRERDDGRCERRSDAEDRDPSLKGKMLKLKGTVNSMVDRWSCVCERGDEGGVCRASWEVRLEWRASKGRGRNVNKMASKLTDQVRSIWEVTKAVAKGGGICPRR
jgi:hypothetical protein